MLLMFKDNILVMSRLVGRLARLFNLTGKKACVCLYLNLVSNQGTNGFPSSQRDLVMRINALPKGTSTSNWFPTNKREWASNV